MDLSESALETAQINISLFTDDRGILIGSMPVSLHIPPQLVHNAKNGDELTSCDYCGRILYWQAE